MISYSSRNSESGKEANDYADYLDYDEPSDKLHDSESENGYIFLKENFLTTNKKSMEPYICDHNNQLDVIDDLRDTDSDDTYIKK